MGPRGSDVRPGKCFRNIPFINNGRRKVKFSHLAEFAKTKICTEEKTIPTIRSYSNIIIRTEIITKMPRM